MSFKSVPRIPFLVALGAAAAVLTPGPAKAQDAPLFTADFPAEEFAARREAVIEAIGPGAAAVLQGAPSPLGYVRFRQTNSFYYLTGVETPHAYLLLDGTSGRSVLYLPHRNDRREASEGRLLSAEDAELAKERTGVDAVYGSWRLSDDLARLAWGRRPPVIHTPLSPAELAAMSRDLATRGNADIANDPWDGRASREANFASRLRDRFPKLRIEDLSPVLDRRRLVKSEREIALITKATRLSGLALMEAMRSTRPGIFERELDAVGKFLFFRDGAQSDGYYSLVAAGTNAWYPHYHRGASRLEDGDLILMDYAPDVGYYTSDVSRMWPVNGRFSEWQRDLYGFYLACYRAVLDAIRPGEVAAVMGAAATRMEEIVRDWPFTKPPLPPRRRGVRCGVRPPRPRPPRLDGPRGRDGGPRCGRRRRDADAGDGLHHRAPVPGARGPDLHPPRRCDPHHRRRRRKPLRVRPDGHGRHRGTDGRTRPPRPLPESPRLLPRPRRAVARSDSTTPFPGAVPSRQPIPITKEIPVAGRNTRVADADFSTRRPAPRGPSPSANGGSGSEDSR